MQGREAFDCSSRQSPEAVQPEIRLACPQLVRVTVAITDRANFYARSFACQHVWNRISNKQAILGPYSESFHCPVHNVWHRFAGETIGPLYMLEVRCQTKLREDIDGGRSPLGGCSGFESTQHSQGVGYLRVELCAAVSTHWVNPAIFDNPSVDLIGWSFGKQVGEQVCQMPPDVSLQEFDRHIGARCCAQNA